MLILSIDLSHKHIISTELDNVHFIYLSIYLTAFD